MVIDCGQHHWVSVVLVNQFRVHVQLVHRVIQLPVTSFIADVTRRRMMASKSDDWIFVCVRRKFVAA